MKKLTWRAPALPTYLIVALLLLVGIVLLFRSSDLGPKEIGPALLSLLGTFLGAFLAFRLQLLKDREADTQTKVDLLNRALIVLCIQYNDLAQVKLTLDRYDGKINRMINMPPERSANRLDSRQNVESLAFLIDKGHANLIMKLTIEQGCFDAAHHAIAERFRITVEEVQPAMERHNLNHRQLSEKDIRQAFGERLFGALETATNQLYLHVPLTVDSLKERIDEMHAAADRKSVV